MSPLTATKGPGDRSPGPSLGSEGRDLAGLGLGATPLDSMDVGGGEAQARTDLVGRELDLGAVLALVGLPTALLEATGDHNPHALGEAEGHVLGQVTPADDVEERGVTTLTEIPQSRSPKFPS